MSERSKQYLKSRGLKNPPIDSGISGGGDAPRTYVSDVMDEWNPYLTKLLEQSALPDVPKEVEFNIVDKKRALVESEIDYVGNFFGEIHKEYSGDKAVEVEDFENSNTRLSLLKVDDKTVAMVIENRTAFNHCEFVFCREAHSNQSRDGGWISVEDALPKIGQPVMLFRDNTPNMVIGWIEHNGSNYYYCEAYSGGHFPFNLVTHWRTLPIFP